MFSLWPPLQGGGVPNPRSRLGVPCPRSGWGGALFQIWMGVPHPADGGDLIQDQDGRYARANQGLDGVPPPVRTGWAPPPHQDWMGYPPPRQDTDQHSEHLLHGGRHASCVHAGGLSCFYLLALFQILYLIINPSLSQFSGLTGCYYLCNVMCSTLRLA